MKAETITANPVAAVITRKTRAFSRWSSTVMGDALFAVSAIGEAGDFNCEIAKLSSWGFLYAQRLIRFGTQPNELKQPGRPSPTQCRDQKPRFGSKPLIQ
jgi:hypothetical protein